MLKHQVKNEKNILRKCWLLYLFDTYSTMIGETQNGENNNNLKHINGKNSIQQSTRIHRENIDNTQEHTILSIGCLVYSRSTLFCLFFSCCWPVIFKSFSSVGSFWPENNSNTTPKKNNFNSAIQWNFGWLMRCTLKKIA